VRKDCVCRRCKRHLRRERQLPWRTQNDQSVALARCVPGRSRRETPQKTSGEVVFVLSLLSLLCLCCVVFEE
jgi:hypothetical protein